MPSSNCSTKSRWISCQGVWLAGNLKPPAFSMAARRAASSAALIKISALCFLKSIRTRSPVCNRASPPPAAASGEALRIDGEPDVPDCRPSPMQGSAWMPGDTHGRLVESISDDVGNGGFLRAIHFRQRNDNITIVIIAQTRHTSDFIAHSTKAFAVESNNLL